MIVRKRVYARAGLIGNPSDGYHGKTIAFTFRNFLAEATLNESPDLEFRRSQQDIAVFDSVDELVAAMQKTGYYGGMRLMKAAVKKFVEYCHKNGIDLRPENFAVRYKTDIPRQVGLGGSSAIIMAVMKALMGFYGVPIPEYVLPSVVLAAETEELGLSAGLQDRVVQSYGGLVYMDFDEDFMLRNGYGRYERLQPPSLPNLYIAYRTELSEESGRAHLTIRERYDMGNREVVDTMSEIASLADAAREALDGGDATGLAELVNLNFDLRQRIFPISRGNLEMVRVARDAGASSKFCGSGGAIVGTYDSPQTLERLKGAMEGAGYSFVLPELAEYE